MRGLAACAALAATSACDLVFPPAQLASDDAAVTDADPTAPDGRDEPDAPPGTPDAPPGTPDAPPGTPDAEVSVPDATACLPITCLDDFAANGTAGCGSQAVDWCGDPSLDSLEPYDLCNCTNGSPSLVVFDVTPANLRLAFLPAFASVWYLQVDGIGCIPPTNDCAINGLCGGQPAQLVLFDGIEPSGGPMQFQFWFDDTCLSGGTTFFYTP